MRRPEDWFRQAERDLDHARRSREAGDFEWACFASHQAAEKAAKALHESQGVEAWGHAAAKILEGFEGVPPELVDGAKALDKHYIGTRYPNAHQSGAPADLYTDAEAELAIEHAERIVEYVRGRLQAS